MFGLTEDRTTDSGAAENSTEKARIRCRTAYLAWEFGIWASVSSGSMILLRLPPEIIILLYLRISHAPYLIRKASSTSSSLFFQFTSSYWSFSALNILLYSAGPPMPPYIYFCPGIISLSSSRPLESARIRLISPCIPKIKRKHQLILDTNDGSKYSSLRPCCSIDLNRYPNGKGIYEIINPEKIEPTPEKSMTLKTLCMLPFIILLIISGF